jgi:SOS-response transcriptional repressor LexA
LELALLRLAPFLSVHQKRNEGMSKDQDLGESIYQFIETYIQEHQYSPTVREIAHHCGKLSLSTVVYHLDALEYEGRIRRSRYKSRSLRLLNNPQRFNGLTEEIYTYITNSLKNEGISPSQEEIAVACHLSKAAVQLQLKILEEQGRIRLGKGHRQIQILK